MEQTDLQRLAQSDSGQASGVSLTGGQAEASVPLCIDLDGTLIKTDLLWESLARLLKSNPLHIFLVLVWWCRGRAYLKAQIATRVTVDVATLPYEPAVLELIRSERRAGRPVFLVTASDESLARQVGEHLGLFTEVLASDGKTNLRGKNKGATLAERFGKRGFDYAGNSAVDLPVWEQARQAIVVNGSARLVARAARRTRIGGVLAAPRSLAWGSIRALRPHQWVKNLIIFVPLLTAHKLTDLTLVLRAGLAFLAFSLCASGVYLLNDLCDLESDRCHATKRLRPLAAGHLPLPAALAAFPLLVAASLVLAGGLSWSLAGVLALYLGLTTAYSWRLRQVPLLDVLCLTALYTVRLIAGHEATSIEYSFWLLVFSMFIFLSLALVKRFLELNSSHQPARTEIHGRGYAAGDRDMVAILGASSGYLSVLVLALYVHSPEGGAHYQHPTLLLLVCPLLLFWISRVWLLAHRGQMHDDPIVFALRDPVSYLVGALTLAVLWLATGA